MLPKYPMMSSCLDIPVPRCVQHLLREPPVCMPRGEDAKVLDLIREFGLQLGRPESQIKQACHLACGGSDVVVILERPRPPSKKHNYSASFNEFVSSSPTLSAVDELIRYASKGARSIHTVTVLDGFTLKIKEDDEKPSDNACHDLLEKLLKLKQPKVVLCCWQDEDRCTNPFVRLFKSSGVGQGDVLTQVNIDHSTTVAIRSLHPSYAVYHDKEQKAYARTLLIYHFVLAFGVLAGSTDVPVWVASLCRGSSTERERVQKSELTAKLKRDKKGLVRTVHILRTLARIVKSELPVAFIQRSENRIARQQRREINYLLSQLFSSEYNNGALEITRLCLLWKGYEHPAAEYVMDQLISIGSTQKFFQHPEMTDYIEPMLVGSHIGFGDKNDKNDMVAKLGSLRLRDLGLSEFSIDEENAILARLGKTLTEQTKQLEKVVPVANQLVRSVSIAIDLQATAHGPHNETLVLSLAEFAKDQYSLLHTTAEAVGAVFPVLSGDNDVIKNEEQPSRAIFHRPDIEVILDLFSTEVELVVHSTISFVLQYIGLMAQGKALCSTLELEDDKIGEILMNPPLDLEAYVQYLRRELDAVLSLRGQQFNAKPLIKIEHPVPVVPTTNRSLHEVYKAAYRKAPLTKEANASYVSPGGKRDSQHL